MEMPNTRIVFLINCDMKDQIMDYQEQAAKIYHVEYIRRQEIHKRNVHPTIQGMQQITERKFHLGIDVQ